MKLKKIASLMLAGIMAVSMLAGCKTATEPTDDSSSSAVSTVSDAATAINAALDEAKETISFTGSDELANAVKTYFNNHPIKGDYWKNVTWGEMKSEAGDIATILGVDLNRADILNVKTWLEGTKSNSKETGLVVYAFNQKYNNEDAVLKYVGKMIDEIDYADDYDSKTDDNKKYSYSGNAEIVEVKSANGDVSLWVVAVQFTKDYVNR